MKIFTKITGGRYAFRTLYRASAILFVLGFALGIYTMVEALPTLKEVTSGWFDNTAEYNRPQSDESTTTVETSQERIEQYYEEELEKLAKKYEQMHQDEARNNAIERVEADLEKEKEAIRERALLP